MKLELKHIAPYLPYGLNILYWNGLAKEYIEILQVLHYENRHVLGSEKHKPILRPLSDLTKEIEYNGEKFVPSDWISKNYIGSKFDMDIKILYQFKTYEHLPYTVIENLLKWHFDVFGLIEQGLAFNINALQHFQSC